MRGESSVHFIERAKPSPAQLSSPNLFWGFGIFWRGVFCAGQGVSEGAFWFTYGLSLAMGPPPNARR